MVGKAAILPGFRVGIWICVIDATKSSEHLDAQVSTTGTYGGWNAAAILRYRLNATKMQASAGALRCECMTAGRSTARNNAWTCVFAFQVTRRFPWPAQPTRKTAFMIS